MDIGNPIIVETGTFPFRVDVSGHLPGEGHDARWPIRRLGNHEGIAVHRDFIGLPEGVQERGLPVLPPSRRLVTRNLTNIQAYAVLIPVGDLILGVFIVVDPESCDGHHGIAVQSYRSPELILLNHAAKIEADILAMQPVDLHLSHSKVVRRRLDVSHTRRLGDAEAAHEEARGEQESDPPCAAIDALAGALRTVRTARGGGRHRFHGHHRERPAGFLRGEVGSEGNSVQNGVQHPRRRSRTIKIAEERGSCRRMRASRINPFHPGGPNRGRPTRFVQRERGRPPRPSGLSNQKTSGGGEINLALKSLSVTAWERERGGRRGRRRGRTCNDRPLLPTTIT